MFKVEGNHIWLTRGDSAEFRPLITNYEAVEGDKMVFAMKKARNNDAPALRIEVNCGENILFTPELTSNLPTGTYLYDLKIQAADGKVSTFVNAERFDLMGEIDNGRD